MIKKCLCKFAIVVACLCFATGCGRPNIEKDYDTKALTHSVHSALEYSDYVRCDTNLTLRENRDDGVTNIVDIKADIISAVTDDGIAVCIVNGLDKESNEIYRFICSNDKNQYTSHIIDGKAYLDGEFNSDSGVIRAFNLSNFDTDVFYDYKFDEDSDDFILKAKVTLDNIKYVLGLDFKTLFNVSNVSFDNCDAINVTMKFNKKDDALNYLSIQGDVPDSNQTVVFSINVNVIGVKESIQIDKSWFAGLNFKTDFVEPSSSHTNISPALSDFCKGYFIIGGRKYENKLPRTILLENGFVFVNDNTYRNSVFDSYVDFIFDSDDNLSKIIDTTGSFYPGSTGINDSKTRVVEKLGTPNYIDNGNYVYLVSPNNKLTFYFSSSDICNKVIYEFF